MSREKIPVFVICKCENDECGSEFDLKRRTYIERIKNGTPMLCSNCMKKYISEVRRNITSKRFEDPEEHIKTSITTKAGMNKMTIEEKDQMNINKQIGMHNMSPEAKQSWKDNISKSNKKNYENKTPEEKQAYKDKCKKQYAESSDEYKLNHKIATMNGMANIDINDKASLFSTAIINSKQSSSKFAQKFEKYLKSLNDYIIKEEVPFTHDNIIHCWDYAIYDKNDNLQVLIDLDGTFYHADDKYDYDGLFSHEEYDESRYLTIPKNIKSCIIYEDKFEASIDYLNKILKMSYNEFIQRKFEYCSIQIFPFPIYSDKDLIESFNNLIKLDWTDENHTRRLSTNDRRGDHLIYYYHHSIFDDHYDNAFSPVDIWNNDSMLYNLVKSNAFLHNHLNQNKIYQSFNMNSKIRFLSAGKSKMIINKYLSEYDKILNPYDKYSNIMLGALSLNKQYIGIFNEERKFSESLQMLILLNKHFRELCRRVKIVHCGHGLININDFNNEYSYECLFTSLYDDNNCDELIDKTLKDYNCKKYVFVVNNTEKHKNNIVETIYNKNYYNEFIIVIEK